MSVLSRLMDGEIKRISLNLTNPDDMYKMSGGSYDNELIKKYNQDIVYKLFKNKIIKSLNKPIFIYATLTFFFNYILLVRSI